MTFTTDTFARSSFKINQGLAHTSASKDPANEAESSAILLNFDEVWASNLPSDPNQAVSDGYAAYITVNMTLDPSSNGKAYFANRDDFTGTTLQGLANPRIGDIYGSGSDYDVNIDGYRIGFFIPTKYGSDYRVILKDNGTEVPPLSSEDWFFDYRAGIVTSETDLSLGVTGTLDGYVYIGEFLSDHLSSRFTNIQGDLSILSTAVAGLDQTWSFSGTDIINANAGDVLPASDATHNFGDETSRWQDGYFAGGVHLGEVYVNVGDNSLSDQGFVNITTGANDTTAISMFLNNSVANGLVYPTLDWYGNDSSFGNVFDLKGQISVQADASVGQSHTMRFSLDNTGSFGTALTLNSTSVAVNQDPTGLAGLHVFSDDGGTLPSLAGIFEKSTSSTSGLDESLVLRRTSTSASISDTFGISMYFDIGDSGGNNNIARIAAERDNSVDNSGTFRFQTANAGTPATRMTILYSGNVGIGATTPATDPEALLQVASSSTGNLMRVTTTAASATNGGATIQLDQDDGAAIASGHLLGALEWRSNTATGNAVGAYIQGRASGTWTDASIPTIIDFYTTASGSTTPGRRMFIDDSGDVMVGTGSPNTKLHVREDGVVTTPVFQLHAEGATDDVAIRFQNQSNSWCLGMDEDDSDAFKLSDNFAALGTNDRLRITTAGNVTVYNLLTVNSGGAIVNNGSGTDDILALQDNGTDKIVFPNAMSNPRAGYLMHVINTSGDVELAEAPYPSQQITYYDDFLTYNGTSGPLWTETASGAGASVSDTATALTTDNHHGIITMSTGTTTAGYVFMRSSSAGGITVSGGVVTVEAVVRLEDLSDASNEYIFRIGLGDSPTGADHTDGVYFEYDRTNSTNWQGVTASGGTRTRVGSIAVAADTWYRLRLQVASGTATFFVDGAQLGVTSTNVPGSSQLTACHIQIVKSAGTTARVAYVDYYMFHKWFDTAR